jgi:hypothetical protein
MIGLVACCKKKVSVPSRAEELYISPLFRFASLYCKQQYKDWFILSAKYGLLSPDEFIRPYNLTLQDKTKLERQEWGQQVFEQLQTVNLQSEIFFLHAGRLYCEPLQNLIACQLPLMGMGIGRRLAWYSSRLKAEPNKKGQVVGYGRIINPRPLVGRRI